MTNILKDWKHWVGWVLSTLGIVLLATILSYYQITNLFVWSVTILLVIVVFDFIKHKVGLQ